MARDPDAVEATSTERYNGGVRAKRQYGSSTITVFYVHRVRDAKDPSRWLKIEVGGRTPGERKTAAIEEFRAREPEMLAKLVAVTSAPKTDPATDPAKSISHYRCRTCLLNFPSKPAVCPGCGSR